jgi:hypothetical protein
VAQKILARGCLRGSRYLDNVSGVFIVPLLGGSGTDLDHSVTIGLNSLLLSGGIVGELTVGGGGAADVEVELLALDDLHLLLAGSGVP